MMKAKIFRATALLLLFATLFTAGRAHALESRKFEGPGFASPEEAAAAYLMAFKNRDLEAMLAAFAVESLAERYDLRETLSQLKAYALNYSMPLPSVDEFSIQFNAYVRAQRLIERIFLQYMSLQRSTISHQPFFLIRKRWKLSLISFKRLFWSSALTTWPSPPGGSRRISGKDTQANQTGEFCRGLPHATAWRPKTSGMLC